MNNDLISRSGLGIGYANPSVFDKPEYAVGWNAAVKLINEAPAVNAVSFPCKVGDKVFYLFQYSSKRILPFVRTARVREIYCLNRKMQFMVETELLDAAEKGILKSFSVEDFGKTVFLSKKEAEAALEGGTENVTD